MLRLPLLLIAGIALLAASTVPASGDATADAAPEAKATHTLILDYQQTRGDMRRAMLTIAPKEDGARPLWRGKLRAISVLTTKGQWILIDRFQESRTITEARVLLPDPQTVSAILLHPERGGMFGWKVEEGEPGYTEIEWTYFTQDGEETEEPEPEEPEEPADDDKPCNMVDVRDPYTGECGESELKDPYENEMTPSQILLGI
ncbi:MAG: hypothetical protein AAFQ43_01750 [Bacteroidota bacterium]